MTLSEQCHKFQTSRDEWKVIKGHQLSIRLEFFFSFQLVLEPHITSRSQPSDNMCLKKKINRDLASSATDFLIKKKKKHEENPGKHCTLYRLFIVSFI